MEGIKTVDTQNLQKLLFSVQTYDFNQKDHHSLAQRDQPTCGPACCEEEKDSMDWGPGPRHS